MTRNLISKINKNGTNKTGRFFLLILLIIVLIFNIFSALIVSAETADIKNGDSKTVFVNDKASIDFTNSNETGTVKINTVSKFEKKVKVTIIKNEEDSLTYTYDLKNDMTVETYPLQMGDGEYIVKVWFQIEDIIYSLGMTGRYAVMLADIRAPFLSSNQYVNYSEDSKIVKIAAELTKDCASELEMVEEIYKFVIHNIEYDAHKAATVQSGYLPSADEIVDTGMGICIDYAAVFAAMLRSVNIPAKLVTGHVEPDDIYHAWNEFYIKDTGGQFKTNKVKFDGKKFERVDPTFDSASRSSEEVLQFINDDTNYRKFREY
ncbi:MAG: transglutaminase-like domain-containing protein [Oscillospiraceae bacterium]|nr:transglutaminase-like domain-containing protein [Oscillospiraceae bacterium]